MGSKLLGIFLGVAIFMDPCDKQPRKIELQDVSEACRTEVGRMYVRVRGPLQKANDITCGDYPGGRRCELFMDSSGNADQLPLLVRGTDKADEPRQYQSTLVVPKAASKGELKPFGVRFDEVQLYDRNGGIVDHMNGHVDVSGSLQVNHETQRCSLLVLHVERSSD